MDCSKGPAGGRAPRDIETGAIYCRNMAPQLYARKLYARKGLSSQDISGLPCLKGGTMGLTLPKNVMESDVWFTAEEIKHRE